MTTYADLVLLDRPFAFWPLDETSGTVAANRVSSANNGVYPTDGSVTVGGTALLGQPACLFRDTYGGTSTAGPGIVIDNPALLPGPLTAMSVEAWINPQVPEVSGSPRSFWNECLVSLGIQNLTCNYYCYVQVNRLDLFTPDQAGNYPRIFQTYGASLAGQVEDDSIHSEVPWARGDWAHIVITWDNSDPSKFQAYCNGVPWSGSWDGSRETFATPVGPYTAAWIGQNDTGEVQPVGGLANVAVYDYALSSCQVLSHYDLATTGSYTSCADWVRLAHVSGHGHWQSNGARIEEKVAGERARDHDGTTSTVYSADVPVLETPLAVLTTSPPTLVGKDPATNMPAYCPPPLVVAITPAPPPVTPPAVDPNEFRCNIAHYVAEQMELAYGYAVAKINNMNSAQWTLIGLGGPLAGVILALLNVAFPPLLIVTGFGVGLMALLGQHRQSYELLPLGGPAVEAMAKALYCALVPDADGLYQITGTTLFNWSYNLTHFGGDFTGDQLAEVRLLITVYQPEYWHQLAVQAGASGSTLCGGYDCTGLLP